MRFCSILRRHPKDTPGGSEYQTHLISKVLACRGHETFYITTKSPDSGIYSEDGVTVYKLNRGLPSIIRTIRKINPDVLYMRLSSQLLYLPFIKPFFHGIVIYHVSHDEVCQPVLSPWPGKSSTPSTRWVFRRVRSIISRASIQQADMIFTQKDEQSKMLLKNRGVQSKLVGNGHPVPLGGFPKPEPPIVLWLASLKEWKRPEIFVDLAEECSDLQARFQIVGRPADSDVANKIESRVSGISNLSYLGGCSIAESNEYIGKSSIFVNTSISEGFPNTFIQSWLREVPVVSLSVDVNDMLKQGLGGYLAVDQSNLASLVRRLIEHKQERMQLGRDARKIAKKKFDIEKIVDDIEFHIEEYE